MPRVNTLPTPNSAGIVLPKVMRSVQTVRLAFCFNAQAVRAGPAVYAAETRRLRIVG